MGLIGNLSGTPGATGAPGAPGAPGSVWYFGTTVPNDTLGVNGDFYLRTDTGDVYTKVGGTWA